MAVQKAGRRTFRGIRDFEMIVHKEIPPERTGGKDTHCQLCNANIFDGDPHTDGCPKFIARWVGPKIREKTLQPGELDAHMDDLYKTWQDWWAEGNPTDFTNFEIRLKEMERRLAVLEFENRLRTNEDADR